MFCESICYTYYDQSLKTVSGAEWVGQAGRSCCVASLGACRCATLLDFVLFSGTHWAARNRPSTMSWRDARDSCTCSSTRTGRHARTPLAARRGSANKTLPKEVATPSIAILSLACLMGLGWIYIIHIQYTYIYIYNIYMNGLAAGQAGPILLEQTSFFMFRLVCTLLSGRSIACMIIFKSPPTKYPNVV